MDGLHNAGDLSSPLKEKPFLDIDRNKSQESVNLFKAAVQLLCPSGPWELWITKASIQMMQYVYLDTLPEDSARRKNRKTSGRLNALFPSGLVTFIWIPALWFTKLPCDFWLLCLQAYTSSTPAQVQMLTSSSTSRWHLPTNEIQLHRGGRKFRECQMPAWVPAYHSRLVQSPLALLQKDLGNVTSFCIIICSMYL